MNHMVNSSNKLSQFSMQYSNVIGNWCLGRNKWTDFKTLSVLCRWNRFNFSWALFTLPQERQTGICEQVKNTLPHSPGLVEIGLCYSGVWNTWSEYCLLDVYGLTNLQKHLILVTMYSTSNDYGNKFRCMWRLLVSMMKILFIKPVSIRYYDKNHRVTMSWFTSDTDWIKSIYNHYPLYSYSGDIPCIIGVRGLIWSSIGIPLKGQML